jgi:hypothetical protein
VEVRAIEAQHREAVHVVAVWPLTLVDLQNRDVRKRRVAVWHIFRDCTVADAAHVNPEVLLEYDRLVLVAPEPPDT